MLLACHRVIAVALLVLATSCTSNDDPVTGTVTSTTTDAPATVTPVPVGVSTNSQPGSPMTGTIDQPAAARLDCAEPIEVIDAPPDALEVIDGAIALQTTKAFSTPLQLVGTGSADLQFAKTGLVLRAGEQVEIVVVPAPGRTALVWWGNTGNRQPTGRFIVGPCATGGAWMVFPGGYSVSAPGCVLLVVRHEGVDSYVTAAVGAPCDDPS